MAKRSKVRKLGIVPNKKASVKPLLIIVTGTPGSGKSVLAKEVSLLLNGTYVDLNKLALEAGLKRGFDAKRGSHIIDESGLWKALKPLLEPKKAYIIDSHLSHYLPSSKVSLCLIPQLPLSTLKSRLVARGYPSAKVAENLQAHALAVCQIEAQEAGQNVVFVPQKRTQKSLARLLAKYLG